MSSQAEQQKEMMDEQHKQRLIENNLQGPPPQDKDSTTAEVLRYLSQDNDLPDFEDDPVMSQLVSKVTSTANLSSDEVRSNEWVREYLLVLYLSKHPRKEGMHTDARAWAHDDASEHRKPLSPEDRMAVESFVTSSKLALSRSEDFRAVEESVRSVQESIVNDESESDSSGGGILGRIGL